MRGFTTLHMRTSSKLLKVNEPPRSTPVGALRELPLPPQEGFFASSLPPGGVKDFFLQGTVPAAVEDRAEIVRVCLKRGQSQALAWLFLQLEDIAPGKRQSIQLAHTDAVPREQRLTGIDAEFLAQWLSTWINSLSFLDSVELRNIVIGDDAAKAFATLVARNLPLRHLSLSSCGISQEGFQEIATALLGNTTLQSLDVSFNAWGREGVLALGRFLARKDCTLLSLNVSHMRVVATNPHTRVIQSFEEGLSTNLSLQHLGLAGMSMTSGLIGALESHPALTSIDLTAAELDDGAALRLIRKSQLEAINLSDCHLGGPTLLGILDELQRNSTLRHIDFSGIPLKGAGLNIGRMIEHNKHLLSIQLENCELSSDDVDKITKPAWTSSSLQVLNLLGSSYAKTESYRNLTQHLLLNKHDHPRPAQLKNATNALDLLVNRKNHHNIPPELIDQIVRFIGAMGAGRPESLDSLIATAGRLPPPRSTK